MLFVLRCHGLAPFSFSIFFASPASSRPHANRTTSRQTAGYLKSLLKQCKPIVRVKFVALSGLIFDAGIFSHRARKIAIAPEFSLGNRMKPPQGVNESACLPASPLTRGD
jgi:hypothetical protein